MNAGTLSALIAVSSLCHSLALFYRRKVYLRFTNYNQGITLHLCFLLIMSCADEMNQIDHSSLCGRRVTFPRWPPCVSIASRYISHLRPVSFTLRDGFDTHHLVGHFCKLFSENVCLYVCTEQSCYFIIFTLFGCSIQRNSSGLLVHFLISVLENIDTEIFCYPKHVFLLMPLIFVMKFVSVSVIIINIIIIIIIWNGHLSSMCEHVLLAPLLFFSLF